MIVILLWSRKVLEVDQYQLGTSGISCGFAGRQKLGLALSWRLLQSHWHSLLARPSVGAVSHTNYTWPFSCGLAFLTTWSLTSKDKCSKRTRWTQYRLVWCSLRSPKAARPSYSPTHPDSGGAGDGDFGPTPPWEESQHRSVRWEILLQTSWKIQSAIGSSC